MCPSSIFICRFCYVATVSEWRRIGLENYHIILDSHSLGPLAGHLADMFYIKVKNITLRGQESTSSSVGATGPVRACNQGLGWRPGSRPTIGVWPGDRGPGQRLGSGLAMGQPQYLLKILDKFT